MMALITVRGEKRNNQRGRSFDLWAESIEGAKRIALMHVYATEKLIDKKSLSISIGNSSILIEVTTFFFIYFDRLIAITIDYYRSSAYRLTTSGFTSHKEISPQAKASL